MFFYYIQFLLPCAKCRNSYKEHITALPVPRTKEAYTRWVIRVHNRVNQSIDKPIQQEEEMMAEWRDKYEATKTLEDLYFIEVTEYFLYGHPGYHAITEEMVKAHLSFWKIIPHLLPFTIKNRKLLEQALEKHPIREEIVQSKTKYQSWFEKIKQELPKRSTTTALPTADMKCTTICSLTSH